MAIRLGIRADWRTLSASYDAGFSYIETSLRDCMQKSDSEFAELVRSTDDMPISAEVFSDMLPDDMHIVGEDVSAKALHEYLSRAFDRAKALGGKIILLDAGMSRSAPVGFDMATAWRQTENFLRILQGHAHAADISVAILPLRRAETNILNYVSEAVLMTSLVQMNHLGVAADMYQMAMVSEPCAALRNVPNLLYVRMVNTLGNLMPRRGDGENYAAFFQTLRSAEYRGMVTCSGNTDRFARSAKEAYAVLQAAYSEVHL